jgi:hypothetical protein
VAVGSVAACANAAVVAANARTMTRLCFFMEWLLVAVVESERGVHISTTREAAGAITHARQIFVNPK